MTIVFRSLDVEGEPVVLGGLRWNGKEIEQAGMMAKWPRLLAMLREETVFTAEGPRVRWEDGERFIRSLPLNFYTAYLMAALATKEEAAELFP